jgi:hypothetical protein
LQVAQSSDCVFIGLKNQKKRNFAESLKRCEPIVGNVGCMVGGRSIHNLAAAINYTACCVTFILSS